MVIDRQALNKLREIVGGEEADLLELVDSFLEEGAQIVEALSASYRALDLPAVRRAAHSLKSNARDLGARQLADICADIEARCAAGGLPDAVDVEAVRDAFGAAAAVLRSMFYPRVAS